MGYARIQEAPFALEEVLDALRSESAGGVNLYVGTVRGRDGERVIDSLTYEAFPEMALAELERLRSETIDRFGLVDAIVVHRVGRFGPGEPVLLVALAGRHRAETFDAMRHFMDRLKQVVPIWKREEGPEGTAWLVGKEGRRVVV